MDETSIYSPAVKARALRDGITDMQAYRIMRTEANQRGIVAFMRTDNWRRRM